PYARQSTAMILIATGNLGGSSESEACISRTLLPRTEPFRLARYPRAATRSLCQRILAPDPGRTPVNGRGTCLCPWVVREDRSLRTGSFRGAGRSRQGDPRSYSASGTSCRWSIHSKGSPRKAKERRRQLRPVRRLPPLTARAFGDSATATFEPG